MKRLLLDLKSMELGIYPHHDHVIPLPVSTGPGIQLNYGKGTVTVAVVDIGNPETQGITVD